MHVDFSKGSKLVRNSLKSRPLQIQSFFTVLIRSSNQRFPISCHQPYTPVPTDTFILRRPVKPERVGICEYIQLSISVLDPITFGSKPGGINRSPVSARINRLV